MSVEADFYRSKNLFQSLPVQKWNWVMADPERCMLYSVGTPQVNTSVSVSQPTVLIPNKGSPSVDLIVKKAPFDKSDDSAAGLITLFAVRLPPL